MDVPFSGVVLVVMNHLLFTTTCNGRPNQVVHEVEVYSGVYWTWIRTGIFRWFKCRSSFSRLLVSEQQNKNNLSLALFFQRKRSRETLELNPKENISKTHEMNMNDENANNEARKENAEELNVVENDTNESVEKGNLRKGSGENS